jgi:hypothetical protein
MPRDLMFQQEIKDGVQQAYAAIASGGDTVARRHYSDQELAEVPPSAIDWALGQWRSVSSPANSSGQDSPTSGSEGTSRSGSTRPPCTRCSPRGHPGHAGDDPRRPPGPRGHRGDRQGPQTRVTSSPSALDVEGKERRSGWVQLIQAHSTTTSTPPGADRWAYRDADGRGRWSRAHSRFV